MTQFLPAAALQSCFLSIDTPLGLFKAPGDTPLMLIAEADGVRVAVSLEKFGHQVPFTSWKLEAESEAWFGVALGPVELELDWHSITRAEPHIGSIDLRGSSARLLVGGAGHWDRYFVPMTPIVAGNAVPDKSLTFGRWQLVQRDTRGKTIVIFETHPSSTADAG